MIKTFINGYLNPELINPNYRGNWKDEDGDILIAVSCGKVCVILDQWESYPFVSEIPYTIRIPQFKPSEILVGEYCYFSSGSNWLKREFKTKISFHFKYNYLDSEDNTWIYCVPRLIAETPERAQWILDNTDWCKM